MLPSVHPLRTARHLPPGFHGHPPSMKVTTFSPASKCGPSGLPPQPTARPGSSSHILDRNGPQMCQHTYNELAFGLPVEHGAPPNSTNASARLLLWLGWLNKDSMLCLTELRRIRRTTPERSATSGDSLEVTYRACAKVITTGMPLEDSIRSALRFAHEDKDARLALRVASFSPVGHQDPYYAFLRMLVGVTE